MTILPQQSADDLPHAALEKLFREYHPMLVGFAFRYVRSPEVAEELVQEVFLDLWERLEQGHRFGAPKAYLFSAVRNAAASYLRHRDVVERFEPETVELFSRAGPTPDADLRSAEVSAALQRAIARLPERCRLVFTLHHEQGLAHGEIADVLRISRKTVEAQMGRAYKALRKSLASHWP
jgi:RNA polymerase sigma-70 factor (ECF subfamily)